MLPTNQRCSVVLAFSLAFGIASAHAMPVNVPAKIQAEDYSDALDATTGNTGGAYRNDNVDIQNTTDTGGGFNVGWIQNDEWLDYQINVPQTGQYTAKVRVASNPGGGRYRLQIDGSNTGAAQNVAATGGWQSWITQTVDLGTLVQGTRTLRVQIESGSFNINWLELNAVAGGRTTVPAKLEAENYQRFFDTTPANLGGQLRSDAVDIGAASDSGGGHFVGWIAQNEWLEFDINVSQAGSYEADIRVASRTGNGAFAIQIDGNTVSNSASVPNTGDWQSWTTLSRSLGQLSAGNHTLRINMTGPSFNINWLGIKLSQVNSGDQCDTTQECQAIYGSRATDCANSQSDQSICMCGFQPCSDSNTPGDDFLGQFNKRRDLFLAFFDNMPDADDIHSQAGVATLLEDNRFEGVNFYSVLGTYGRQDRAFLNSSSVMNLCFGSTNWSTAHPKDGTNWTNSINRVLTRVESTLEGGGDVWIMEAGQSDFSADMVRELKRRDSSIDTKNRIHIVQHSGWNQDQTTPADLNYVRDNTDYNKIPDGNSANNGSPQYKTNSGAKWSVATSIPGVGDCWAEARAVANENNFSGNGHFNNTAIAAGGFDFSDVVEATWIFGFNSLQNQNSFFDEFPE